MKEILFRGKRVDNGKWVYGSLICAGSYVAILENEDDVHPTDYPYLDDQIGTIDGKATLIVPSTVGQYTGLTDMNGKKIFEGDIVCYRTSCAHRTMKIIHQAGGYIAADSTSLLRMSNLKKDFWNKYMEVIGNIHDNPELLEEV